MYSKPLDLEYTCVGILKKAEAAEVVLMLRRGSMSQPKTHPPPIFTMSYYNQQQAPVGVPPPQGYPPKDAYPPPGYPPQQGYPPQGYPQQGYPPQQYAQPPPQQKSSGCLEGCLAALCCCCMLDMCF